MKFMIIRKADKETEASALPTEKLITDMMAYNEKMIRAGVMVDGYGLQASSKGARLKFSGGKPTITDGPFSESKELVAGFTLIEVKSKAEAIEWARQWPPIDGHGEVELEIRQVVEAGDLGPEAEPFIREQEEKLRALAAAKK